MESVTFNGSQYYFNQNSLDFEKARSECERKGYHLAYVKDKTTLEKLLANKTTEVGWIGLRNDAWLDGSKYEDLSDDNKRINTFNKCGYLTKSNILMAECTHSKKFVCQKDIFTTTETFTNMNTANSIGLEPPTTTLNANNKSFHDPPLPIGTIIPVILCAILILILISILIIYLRRRLNKKLRTVGKRSNEPVYDTPKNTRIYKINSTSLSHSNPVYMASLGGTIYSQNKNIYDTPKSTPVYTAADDVISDNGSVIIENKSLYAEVNEGHGRPSPYALSAPPAPIKDVYAVVNKEQR